MHYCCCDGGSANRSFIKLHFSGKDPMTEKFTTINPYTREPLVFLMDPYVSFSNHIKFTFQEKATGLMDFLYIKIKTEHLMYKRWPLLKTICY